MHHPNKRVQRTKAPRWDGSEIGGTRGPQLPKDYWGRMPTNYWLRRAACTLRKENYWLGRAACELQLQSGRRSGGPRKKDCGAAAVLARGAPDSRCSRAGEKKQEGGSPHHRLVEQESQCRPTKVTRSGMQCKFKIGGIKQKGRYREKAGSKCNRVGRAGNRKREASRCIA